MGHAGSIRLNGIPIAGASGIFKANDFRLGMFFFCQGFVIVDLSFSLFTGHYEKLPYDAGSMRSIYHIREYCVRKLSLVSYVLGCLNTWIEIQYFH
jgi:lariat debranching enzyme